MISKPLYPQSNLISVYGNSTKLFKLLMYLTEDEFNQLNNTVQDIEKFKELSTAFLIKYQDKISGTYINPAAVRIALTEKLIPIDFTFLRSVAIAER